MNIFARAAGFSRPRLGKQTLVSLLSLALFFAPFPNKWSRLTDGYKRILI